MATLTVRRKRSKISPQLTRNSENTIQTMIIMSEKISLPSDYISVKLMVTA